ncbi:MAG TPA: DUF1254 domain-containing protein [Myxococcota bacterium]|nr:DUF1254 domain-containing protein [Myxococcota bacterium]
MRRPLALAALALLALAADTPPRPSAQTPEQVRAIAKEAYVYGYPIVDNYRVIYTYTQDTGDPDYKAPLNVLKSEARVFTPEDRAIQTPNSDTPYSFLAMDLRAEPLVLTIPPIDPGRYFSVQLVDLYTFNFAYLGSRTSGNGGGDYLVAGPSWTGEPPPGVKQVIRSETQLALAIYRTQLLGPDDLAKVQAIQAGYKVQPLSAYLGRPAPSPAYAVNWHKPPPRAELRTSPDFFNLLSFALQFAPVHPSEAALRARIDSLYGFVTPEQLAAFAPGMADGQKEIDARIAAPRGADSFGSRELLKDDYVTRAAAAQLGIYGNSKEEAVYLPIDRDARGKPLDGAHRYLLHFAKGKLPPVNAFWSVTMYSLPDRLLVPNPLGRYLVNSPMLPSLRGDRDGGLTLYLQHDSPGKELESNWLPAPSGAFWAVLRLYWPKPEVLSGRWKPPAVRLR